jgi:pimeloyl-ACP methyl ester carboxylesterase
MNLEPRHLHLPDDAAVETAQRTYLERCAPGYRARRVQWSEGTTQIIELGAGTPLLLLHGGMGEAFQWGPILSPLARRHRVLAVDRPGHGLADPFDYRGVDLLVHARRFLSDILDAEKLPSAAIVGSSMGGMWAVAFALAYPNRVTHLILPGAPAGLTRALPLQMRLGALPGLKRVVRTAMSRPTRDGTRAFWKQMLVAHPQKLENDFLDLSAASQRRNCRTWFSLMDSAFGLRGMKPELLLAQRWQELAVPTTLVLGEKDAFGGMDAAVAAAASNRRIRLVRIADAGHAPWFDQPDQVVQAIEAALGGP